jgi:hypothetical protein
MLLLEKKPPLGEVATLVWVAEAVPLAVTPVVVFYLLRLWIKEDLLGLRILPQVLLKEETLRVGSVCRKSLFR